MAFGHIKLFYYLKNLSNPKSCILPIIILFLATTSWAQSLGNLAQYPPTAKDITITTAVSGEPVLEPMELKLMAGRYYRLTINCPDVRSDLSGWRIEMAEFLSNAHLRLISVGDIEIHLQGLSFNAIECDEIGSVHVSFVPIRPGDYSLYVGNVPFSVGRPIGESGVQTKGKFLFGKITVK